MKQDRDYDGLVETRLYLGVATRSSFRAYTLVAENSIATTTKLVQLRRSTCIVYVLYRHLPGANPEPLSQKLCSKHMLK